MARRTKEVVITDDGRDKGKRFFLTEMSATQAEWWAVRVCAALVRAGIDIPDNIQEAGLAGLAAVALNTLAHLNHADARGLMDEMMECIQISPDPAHPQVHRALIEDDIEEVLTRVTLKREVLELHLGFSLRAAPSTSDAGAPPRMALAS